ncbi:MAG: protein kinase [Actinomycetota bacterium]|nr:protein kinase [Actinomycetota bacterium]
MSGDTTGGPSGSRWQTIEVVVASADRRVERAFDTELRQVVGRVSEPLAGRDPDELLRRVQAYLAVPATPSLSPVVDASIDDGEVVVVNSWVEGVDLLSLLAASGTPGLPVTAVLSWLDEVADALRHLHSRGLVHGDVRPSNLILTADQRIVVIGVGVGALGADAGTSVEDDIRSVAATAAVLLTGSAPDDGSITGTSTLSAIALQRALLPALDPARSPPSLDELLRSLRSQLNDALPSGVVTFLLTDIVGSTRQWEADATTMSVQLAHHDQLMAEAVEQAGGRFLKARGEGDSTFSVFRRATEAVRAALDAQRRLRAETGLVVRMSIHTGEAELRGVDYFGRTVNRAARLRSVAPDGGVILSSASSDLVRDHLPDGVTLIDQGDTVLKDLERAERTFRLMSAELADVTAVQLPEGGIGALPRVTEEPMPRVSGELRPIPPPPAAPVPAAASSGGSPPRPAGRRKWALVAGLVVLAVVLGAVALLGGDDDTPSTSGGATTTSTSSPSDDDTGGPDPTGALGADLADRLVPLGDLGGPYTRIEPIGVGTGAEPCGQDNVDAVLAPDEVAGSVASDSEGTTSVTQSLRSYGSSDRAAEALALTRAAVDCAEVSVADSSGATVSGAAGPLEDVVVGAGRSGFLTELVFGPYVVTTGSVQVDDVVVSVQFGVFRTDGVDGRELTRQLLSLLVARLDS